MPRPGNNERDSNPIEFPFFLNTRFLRPIQSSALPFFLADFPSSLSLFRPIYVHCSLHPSILTARSASIVIATKNYTYRIYAVRFVVAIKGDPMSE